MISLSTTAPVRFTPPWREQEDAPPVYLIRAGSVIERAQFEAELAGEYGAERVFDYELLAAMEEGLGHILPDAEARERVLDAARTDLGGGELEIAERQIVEEARELLREHWPPYRTLVTRAARRVNVAPVLAFRRFCVGWEGIDGEFAAGPDRLITMAALAAVNPIEMQVAGNVAYGLLYGHAHAGNSARPLSSESGPAISNSDEPSPAAGKSKAKGGKKTPASPSPSGSGA